MASHFILLIHPDGVLRKALQEAFSDSEYDLVGCDTPREGLARFHDMTKVDLVLVDSGFKSGDAQVPINEMRALNSDIPFIYIGTEDESNDIQSMVFSAMEKELDFSDLKSVIDSAVEQRTAVRQERALINLKRDDSFFHGMIGESPSIRDLKSKILRIAPTNATVLLTGESGTGKEVAARSIVQASMRADKPFVVVNAAAIPKDLIESELFGHEKGAFTNAVKTKKGKFELAHEGTLFLDEVGDMPLESQAKLLRVLEHFEVDRVGSERSIRVDVRVIAATNANLWNKVKDGEFREDLYYRLDVIHLAIPSLRQRHEDIPLLVNHYLSILKDQYKQHKVISLEAVRKLIDYTWPGNIRQLRNTLERSYLLSANDEITVDDIELKQLSTEPAAIDGQSPIQYNGTLEDLEMKVILDTLERTGGNKTEAARILGIGTKTLYRKLEKHNKTVNPG